MTTTQFPAGQAEESAARRASADYIDEFNEVVTSAVEAFTALRQWVAKTPGDTECDILLDGLTSITAAIPELIDLLQGWASDLWTEARTNHAASSAAALRVDLATLYGITTRIPPGQ